MVQVRVHVTPKASKDEVCGWKSGELQVRVRSAPESGKATAAVCEVLAKALGVPKSSVEVTRGHTSRHKSIRIEGVDDTRLTEVFGEAGETLF